MQITAKLCGLWLTSSQSLIIHMGSISATCLPTAFTNMLVDSWVVGKWLKPKTKPVQMSVAIGKNEYR